MRFICDDNLGKLAKYLRILGFDTLFQEPIDDGELLRLASAESRFLLTRDHRLRQKIHPFGFLLIEMDYPMQQLAFVIRELGLQIDPRRLFSRCSRCNTPCVIFEKDQATGRVFPYILKTHEVVSQCPSCGRYYWAGSHYKNLLRVLKDIIPAEAILGQWPQ